jgi:hypothetical protein
MTLVAYHGFGGGLRPVFVSDLLAGRNGPVVEPADLPTVGRVKSEPSVAGFNPTGVRQKLAIVGNDLVIAGAGSMLQGRTLARVLDENLAEISAMAPDQIVSLLEELTNKENYTDLDDLTAFVYRMTPTHGLLAFFGDESTGRWGCQSSPMFGQVSACGTGAWEYVDRICSLDFPPEAREKMKGRSVDEIALALLPVGHYLATEVLKGDLDEGASWGAGFEITAYSGGPVSKARRFPLRHC